MGWCWSKDKAVLWDTPSLRQKWQRMLPSISTR
jgi:hypothetical protein